MSTNHDSTPSALPTLQDVARFMRHWHGQITFIGQQAAPKPAGAYFSISISEYGGEPSINFHGSYIGNGSRGVAGTPEAMMEEILREIGPDARAARAADLRKQADELERGAHALAGGLASLSVEDRRSFSRLAPGVSVADHIAKAAYIQADAMIAARDGKGAA